MAIYAIKEICLHASSGVAKIWSTQIIGYIEARSPEDGYKKLGLVPIKIANEAFSYFFVSAAGNSWKSLMQKYNSREEEAKKKKCGAFFYAYGITEELLEITPTSLKLFDNVK